MGSELYSVGKEPYAEKLYSELGLRRNVLGMVAFSLAYGIFFNKFH